MNFLRTIDKRFWWICAVAAVLIFFRFTHVDMTGDDAHYSARAIGLADFMFGDAEFQSTPLLWYNHFPWWAHLSFHDHPLLLFLIQHVFLSIDDSVFFAKLPFALFALGALLLLYGWMRREAGNRAALCGALLLALHAHFLWTGRVSFMEAGVIFFILLSFLAFSRFLADSSRWYEFGIALGLALSVKFTTLFLLPSFAAVLVLRRRDILRSKELLLAAAAALIVWSPTLLYNVFMYHDLGHFSLQFARLLGQKTPWDFGGITHDYAASARALVYNLGALMSWPYFAAWMASVAYGVWAARDRVTLPLAGCIFLFFQQMLIGQGGYVLAPFAIFAAALTGPALAALPLSARRPLAAALAAYLILFAVNSHTLVRHAGPVGWLRSSVTSENLGVYQLDRYMEQIVRQMPIGNHDIFWYMKKPGSGLQKYLAQVSQEDLEKEIKHATVILYDGNINWFSRVWLFERRRFYDNAPFISTNEQHLLNQLTIADLYLIVATDAAPLEARAYRNDRAVVFASQLFSGVSPVIIRRDDGAVAFKVYHKEI